MQPEHDAPLPPLARTAPAPNRRRMAAIAVLCTAGLLLGGCGSSDEATPSGGDDTETTASDVGDAPDGATGDDGSDTTAVPAGSDLDLCAEVTLEDVGAILTEADLSSAGEVPGRITPGCQYFVEVSGMELAVAQVLWDDPSYYDGQVELQTDAEPVPGIEDAILVGGNTIVAKGETGTITVVGGVELAEGGETASVEQLAAIAELALDL